MPTRTMKLIGYWMVTLQDERLPLPQELVGGMETGEKDAVLSYMARGQQLEAYRGVSWCRFLCETPDAQMGHREFTDGEWVWPEGLVHYVATHNIILPEEFVAAAVSNQSMLQPSSDQAPSLEFWTAWAAERRDSSLRAKLADALLQAKNAEHAALEKERSKMAAAFANAEGKGDEFCIWAGCSRRVLRNRKICAWHMVTSNNLEHVRWFLYSLPRDLLRSPQPGGE